MPLIDVAAAAEYLGTSERHIYYLVQTRQVASLKIGGKLRFRTSDVDAYVASRVRPAVAGSAR